MLETRYGSLHSSAYSLWTTLAGITEAKSHLGWWDLTSLLLLLPWAQAGQECSYVFKSPTRLNAKPPVSHSFDFLYLLFGACSFLTFVPHCSFRVKLLPFCFDWSWESIWPLSLGIWKLKIGLAPPTLFCCVLSWVKLVQSCASPFRSSFVYFMYFWSLLPVLHSTPPLHCVQPWPGQGFFSTWYSS